MLADLINFIMNIDFWKLVTILIAGFVAWVSWSQHSVSKEKFKLDLFEKRFLVFAATRKFLSIILQKANITLEDLFEYRANTAEAAFLFDSDITDYLKEIDNKALSLHTLREIMGPLRVGEERSEKAKAISEHLTWLTDQLPELKPTFSPYMKFKTWK